jgi:DNA repair exonuclease SbcCD ATPase subunit
VRSELASLAEQLEQRTEDLDRAERQLERARSKTVRQIERVKSPSPPPKESHSGTPEVSVKTEEGGEGTSTTATAAVSEEFLREMEEQKGLALGRLKEIDELRSDRAKLQTEVDGLKLKVCHFVGLIRRPPI